MEKSKIGRGHWHRESYCYVGKSRFWQLDDLQQQAGGDSDSSEYRKPL
jgi:hypothetical protein